MFFFFFSSSSRHTRFSRDWSSDVCSSDLESHQRLSDACPSRRGRLARFRGSSRPSHPSPKVKGPYFSPGFGLLHVHSRRSEVAPHVDGISDHEGGREEPLE